jgi:glutathione S-transferase
MDSSAISQYLETTYPSPSLPLTSSLGAEIESKSNMPISEIMRVAVTPREVKVLRPEAEQYFRQTRGEALGVDKLETLLEDEEEMWKSVDGGMSEVNSLLMMNQGKGPFILGDQATYSDFVVVGLLHAMRVVDEDVWKRVCQYPGFKRIYDGCAPFMEKRD